MLSSASGNAPQHVGQHVRNQPVELFGQGTVTATQARLVMNHRDLQLAADHGTSRGGIDVAYDHQLVGDGDFLLGGHHPPVCSA
jgi:hypothetical protein